jgi:tetratricopeptide (TPR) repeat protein
MRRTKQRAAMHSMLAILFLAVAAPAGATAGAPPDAAAGDSWRRVETPHFAVLGQVPEPRLVAIAGRLEAYRAALEWLHPGTRSSPRETSVYVFRSAAAGLPYTPAPAAGGHRLGVHPPYDVPNYVTMAAPLDDPPLEVLYHAYAHQFLDDNFPQLPLTVTEGLAEYYSGFAPARGGTLIGVAIADHLHRLREGGMPPLTRQFSLDARAPALSDAPARAAFVAGSWAMMHYLVSGSGQMRARLPMFLEGLRMGTPAAAVTQAALGMSLDSLQTEVGRYIERDRHLPIRIRHEAAGTAPPGAHAPDVAPDPVAIKARPMGEDEVLAALGDLLAHGDAERAADAEKHLRAALRLNPEQARAHAGLGYLQFARGFHQAAIPFLERAVAIEPDAMSCYLLARSILRVNEPSTGTAPAGTPREEGTPAWLARVRGLLARAIALRPRFAAPYVELGATHIFPDGDVDAGIEILDQARSMLPARMDIARTLVYLLLRKGDFVRARALIDGVLARGGMRPRSGQRGRRWRPSMSTSPRNNPFTRRGVP